MKILTLGSEELVTFFLEPTNDSGLNSGDFVEEIKLRPSFSV